MIIIIFFFFTHSDEIIYNMTDSNHSILLCLSNELQQKSVNQRSLTDLKLLK